MGRLSDDGQWWWDGANWVPTSQVVLPQLPPPDPQRSRRATKARERLERYGLLYAINDIDALTPVLLLPRIPFYLRGYRAMRDYRAWTLDQLTVATSYLLGPDESMVAGETTLVPPGSLGGDWKQDLALAVTEAHVVVFRIDYFGGQPRWIALAATAPDVTIEKRPPLLRDPGLVVSGGGAIWTIRGSLGVWKPDPVIEAWRQAANRTPRSALST